MRKIAISSLIITAATIAAPINSPPMTSASALEYQGTADMQFTLKPTVSIDISGNLSIDTLSPGNSADSDEITVTAGSNNLGGYVLYATVGSSTYASTDLRKDWSDANATYKFASISENKSSLANFSDDTWGYSYCITSNDCTDSTYWISGDYDDYDTGYNTLPLYTATGVKLAETSDITGTTSLKFKIGAKASASQVAGTYTNVINFTALSNTYTTDYTITYNDASGDETVTNLPSSQSGTIDTDPVAVTLSSTEPTRDGYTFAGWCDTDNSSDPTSCSGATYAASSSYSVSNTGSTVTIPLYAIWESSTTYYTVTVNFDGGNLSASDFLSYFTGITVTNSTDATDVQYITTDGGTVSLEGGVSYTVEVTNPGTAYGSPGVCYNNNSGVYAYGAKWTTTANGTLGSSTGVSTTYEVSGEASLTAGADGWGLNWNSGTQRSFCVYSASGGSAD